MLLLFAAPSVAVVVSPLCLFLLLIPLLLLLLRLKRHRTLLYTGTIAFSAVVYAQ